MTSIARAKQRRKPLALPLVLILAGILFLNPMNVLGAAPTKQSNLLYLYPMPQNNPVQPYGLFFSENINLGTHPLNVWQESFPDKRMVIGVPDQYKISQAMIANNLGNYVVARIRNKIKDSTVKSINKNNKKPDPPEPPKNDKEVIFIERTVGNITEKVRIEVGEHLKDSDTFQKIYDSLNKGLIPKDTLEKEIENHKPAPKQEPKPENAEAATMVFGGTLLLSGLALLAKVLIFAL